MTLACEDGQQVAAHKKILAASSPFFENILHRNKHPHPLIYLRGFQSQDILAILDFLYFGEANIFQENLDSFLTIAEELKLEGLTGSGHTTRDVVEEKENCENPKPIHKTNEPFKILTTYNNINDEEEASKVTAIPNQFSSNLQALDEKVMSMMEKGQNMIPNGKRADGTQNQTKASICKVCGKEGFSQHIIDHIEANHLEGISIPCDHCDKVFTVRTYLRVHKAKYHK